MTLRYATRLNSFGSVAAQARLGQDRKLTIEEMVTLAGQCDGLTDLDLNYPDHVENLGGSVRAAMADAGLNLSGMALRYYTMAQFKAGAFTSPDKTVRRSAIDLTKRGIDAGREMGTNLMTIWPGPEGFETSFQVEYDVLWDLLLEGIRAVAEHDPDCNISLEYKPDEPRAKAILPDCATTLLFLDDLGMANTGVTLDFAHALYAGETPARAAAMIARRSKLLGVHLNDGYGKRDDGLMVASVNPHATLELLMEVRKAGFDGPIYFDTFPDTANLDPVAECEANITTTNRLLAAAERLERDNRLKDALSRQDAVGGLSIANDAMLRAPDT